MAQYITYGNFKAKILRDCDLEQEQFITPTELIGITNTALANAEAIIMGIYEDYFLTSTTTTLINNVADYDLPVDIYGDKIRGILLTDTSNNVSRLKREKDFLSAAIRAQSPNDNMRYIVVNNSSASKKIRFFPTPTGQNLGTLTIYYLRGAAFIDDTASQAAIDATVMDIPEFQNYLYADVKLQVAAKEKLGQDLQVYDRVVEAQAKLMVDTLSSRIPDDDDEIPVDLRLYYDFYQNEIDIYSRS